MEQYKEIAEAVRIEQDDESGELFIVFKITDHNFRKEVVNIWLQDIEYKIVNKRLVLK